MFKKCNYTCKGKGKGKGQPIKGHEGQELEYRYSSTLSLTSAIDGVGDGRFIPGKVPVYIETIHVILLKMLF
jgi:hypothetical protein